MTTKKVTPGATTPQDAGRQLHAALSNDGTPEFMMGATILAIRVACERLGEPLPAWLADEKGDDGASLTALFERVPRGFDFTLEAPRDLAEIVADVWHHPDCPEEIREALNVGTSDLFNRLNEEEGGRRVYQTAPYIRALLVEHAAREGGSE
jgi:hypothetical protein